jgi:hypothetical protein
MDSKNRLTSVDSLGTARPISGPVCQCLADFFREEFLKHHHCLEQQREYFSDNAIAEAEDALCRAMAQIDGLCQRDDACEVISRLLRQIDAVTKLSAWTEPETLH